MSKLVDERVVEMKFDNSNFERNTRQSMSTIQALKSSLNFSGMASSINQCIRSVDFNPIEDGFEKATKSFSAWEVAVITAISNITNRIVDLGLEMVKSLSVDNIKSGWDKFAEQTKSTGTIISQLSSTMDEAAATTLTSEYMEKLMWFADATSYSLTDMTSAIGKFIAKGKDMDTSFNAAVGIANWAASAGKSATEAQGAFEALAKVSDHVLARQWYSIQSLNMDTIEFKNAALEAATELGMLTKSAERFDGTIEYMTKKGNIVTAETFVDNFSDGWFTLEALLKTLGNYGSSVEKVMELQKELGLETPYEALDIFQENAEKAAEQAKSLGDEEAEAAAQADVFSAKAFQAASEARTLEDALNAVKDAVSTGWLNIFQKIIGEYAEATNVFSKLADDLVTIFLAPINKINDILDKEENIGFRELLFGESEELEDGSLSPQGAIWNILDFIKQFAKAMQDAFSEVFNTGKTLKELTQSFQQFTSKLIMTTETSSNVKNIFKGVFSVLKLGIKVLKGVWIAVQPIFNTISKDSGNIIKTLGNLANKFTNWVNQTLIFNKIGERVANAFTTIITTFKEMKVIDTVTRTFKEFIKELNFGEGLSDIWKSVSSILVTLFTLLLKGVKALTLFLINYALPVILDIAKFLIQIAAVLGAVIIKTLELLFDSIKALFEYMKTNESVQNGWAKFVEFMASIPSRLQKLGPFFIKLGTAITSLFNAIWNGIKKFGDGLANVFHLQTFGELMALIGERIAYGFNKIVESLKSLSSADVTSGINNMSKELTPLQTLFKGIIDLFRGLWNVLKASISVIGKIMTAIGNLLTFIANSINKTFNQDVYKGEGGISFWQLIAGGIGVLLVKGLYDFVALFRGVTSAITKTINSLGGVMRAKAAQMWATAIKDVAIAILMMVGAILIITMIDPDKLKTATQTLIAVMTSLGIIIVAMAAFLKTTYDQDFSANGFKFNFKSKGTGFTGVGAMILSFGLAVLALAAALKVIDSINPDRIWKDLAILGIMMAALAVSIGMMNLISEVGQKANSAKTRKGIKGVLSFALAVWVLTIPISKFGSMPFESLMKGITGVISILLAYAVAIRIMNGLKSKGMAKIAVFAVAMSTIAVPLQLLAKLSWEELAKGLAVISVVAAAYTAIVKMSSSLKTSEALSMIAIMYIFSRLMYSIAELIEGPISMIDEKDIVKFDVITATLLIFFYSMTKIFEATKKTTKKAKKAQKDIVKTSAIIIGVMLGLAAVIVAIVHVSKMMKNVGWAAVFKTITLLGTLIGATALVVEYAKRVKIGKKVKKNLAMIGLIMAALIVAATKISLAALIMNAVNWGSILKTFTAVGLTLAGIALLVEYAKKVKITTKAKKNILAMSAILVALSTVMLGLAVLVSATKAVNAETLVKTLILVAGALVILVAAVYVMSKFKKNMLEVSGALALLALSLAAFGLAAIEFSYATKLLKKDGLDGLLVLTGILIVMGVVFAYLGQYIAMFSGLLIVLGLGFALLGSFVLEVGLGFYFMAQAMGAILPYFEELADKAGYLKDILAAMIEGVITGFANALPTIAQKVLEFVDIFVQDVISKIMGIVDWIMKLDLKDVGDFIKKLCDILFALIDAVLDQLVENVKSIVDRVVTIILGAIEVLKTRVPEIANGLISFVLELIEAIGQGIEDNAEKLRNVLIGVFTHSWNAFLNFFGIHSPSKLTQEAAWNMIQGWVVGFGNGMAKAVKAVIDFATKLWKTITSYTKKFTQWGKDVIQGIWNGIKSVANGFINFWKNLWNGIVNTFKNIFGIHSPSRLFYEFGQNTMEGYQNGLDDSQNGVSNTMDDIYDSAAETWSDTDIYDKYGKLINQALSDALIFNGGIVFNAVNHIIDQCLFALNDSTDEFTDSIKAILAIIENQITDEDLVIRPVMDLSNISEGTGYIAAMLSSVSGYSISGSTKLAEQTSSDFANKKVTNTVEQVSTQAQSVGVSGNGSYNFTFNMYGVNDPKELAEQVNRIFQHEISRR